MTAQSTPPGGWETRTFHGPTGDAGAEEREGTESPPVFERGARLGRYLVLDLLGRGGMGEVYVAYDPELERKVALKMLRSGLGGRDAQDRLIREAQAAARLTHPNVVRVYDVGTVGDRVFVAMELVDGQTLDDWLAQDRKPWREVLKVFIAAGRGLAAAHAAGLIHRDFKPSNVMVTAAGEARVIDFGIAHLVQEAAARAEGTQPGTPGTPAYLAPERLAAGPADVRSDQFSFCVALYAALCGDHPFFADGDPAGSLERLRRGEVKDGRRVRALPGWLARALRRGSRPSPAERFPAMEALLAVLASGLQRRRRAWLGVASGEVPGLSAAGGRGFRFAGAPAVGGRGSRRGGDRGRGSSVGGHRRRGPVVPGAYLCPAFGDQGLLSRGSRRRPVVETLRRGVHHGARPGASGECPGGTRSAPSGVWAKPSSVSVTPAAPGTISKRLWRASLRALTFCCGPGSVSPWHGPSRRNAASAPAAWPRPPGRSCRV